MNTMKAIRFEEYGGPEVLKYIDVDIPEIGDREVLVSVKAIGVNLCRYSATRREICGAD